MNSETRSRAIAAAQVILLSLYFTLAGFFIHRNALAMWCWAGAGCISAGTLLYQFASRRPAAFCALCQGYGFVRNAQGFRQTCPGCAGTGRKP